ncbi:hypothetical protein UFOVP377_43 [uncultured Caudovirales phage]|uniref:Uncharacterized protein n=1 Tax=uncultured Caudovirales phage TaxID=2100421 RepID=A0A6J7WY31_9CAUD|nr:hypothetical protein UFOVP377_43 [uncultured Caudovirales phage]
MDTKQEIKERMRLYEMYSSAVLAGYSSIDSSWSTDTMLKEVDKTTKAMIEYHFIYLLECEDE